MGIAYVPVDVQPFEIRDIEYSVDPWNMDTAQRVFAMRKVDRTDFERRLRKNLPDSELVNGGFGTMYVMDWHFSLSQSGAWYLCTINEGGLRSGIIPAEVISDSVTSQTVQAQSLNGTQVEIDYYSPETTYRYVATSRPSSRRFAGVIVTTDFDLQVFGRRGSHSGSARTSGINAAIATDYYFQRQYFTPTFQTEQVGRYWRVTETTQLRLIESDLLGFSSNVQ